MVNIFSAVQPGAGRYGETYAIEPGRHYAESVPGSVFMIILDMGTAGAALATLLAKAVPATVAFILLCRPENDICLNRRYMQLQRENWA